MYNRELRGPLIIGEKSYHQISTDILAPTETKPGKWWFAMMTIATLASIWGIYSIYITVTKGIGTCRSRIESPLDESFEYAPHVNHTNGTSRPRGALR